MEIETIADAPIPGEEVKPISESRLFAIFTEIGLDREQIAAITKGKKPKPPRIVARLQPKRHRCAVCGQQINARNCKPFRQL